ncbi:DegT/DnrJ/EryC1/StrS family aminotransferase [Chloroflexota bacterium]
MGENKVPAFDLQRQYQDIKTEIDAAVAGVLARGNFILGEEVAGFEAEFAQYSGAKYGVGVGSGTEALHLSLLALGIGAGDEVITVANTAVPTVSAISETGASPVLVDIKYDTYTMDIAQLEAAITPRTKAIIPVHLYGNAVDMESLMKVAGKYQLVVVEDACQAHGAEYKGRKVGTIGTIGAFSFYPTKNLGGYGDGGMVITSDEALAGKVRQLRFYGMADKEKYLHVIKGINSRLDEMQAAILRVKLRHLDKWNESRRAKAALYNQLLPEEFISLPYEPPYARHVYHLYVVRTERRDELRRYLKRHRIDTLIHYPTPIHLQPAYADLGLGEGAFPVSEKCAREILSLPMFPELSDVEIRHVAQTVRDFF